MYDGGVDIHVSFNLSGEPIPPQILNLIGTKPSRQMNVSEIAANNVTKREYQKRVYGILEQY